MHRCVSVWRRGKACAAVVRLPSVPLPPRLQWAGLSSTAPHAQDGSAEGARAGDPFRALGVPSSIVARLEAKGIVEPTPIQSLAFEAYRKGRHIIMTAETGTGKTLGYLLPSLLVPKWIREARGEGEAGDKAHEATSSPSVLVLVPSTDLALQVAGMALSVGISAAVVRHFPLRFSPTEHPWAVQPVHREMFDATKTGTRLPVRGAWMPAPYVLVATPAGLANRRNEMSVFSKTHTVVFDESDMLLDDGAVKSAERVLTMLRQVHETTEEEIIEEKRLRRNAKSVQRELGSVRSTAGDEIIGVSENTAANAPPPASNGGSVEAKDVFLAQRIVLVGATLPSRSKGTVGQYIMRRFPHSVRAETQSTHHVTPLVSQRFVRISSEEEKMGTVENILESELGFKRDAKVATSKDAAARNAVDAKRALVFVGTADRAASTHKYLAAKGFRALPYHANLKLEERFANLEALRTGSADMLVCTDGAARGLDLPVDHVVQMDFAPSAVTYLHRSGRTGRAGRKGTVTSVLVPSDSDLGSAIEANAKSSLDSAFSRNRGFRRRIKRAAAEAAAEESGGSARASTSNGSM